MHTVAVEANLLGTLKRFNASPSTAVVCVFYAMYHAPHESRAPRTGEVVLYASFRRQSQRGLLSVSDPMVVRDTDLTSTAVLSAKAPRAYNSFACCRRTNSSFEQQSTRSNIGTKRASGQPQKTCSNRTPRHYPAAGTFSKISFYAFAES